MTEMLFLKAKTLEQWRQAAATTHVAQYERLLKQASHNPSQSTIQKLRRSTMQS